jgi:hypothetical protein
MEALLKAGQAVEPCSDTQPCWAMAGGSEAARTAAKAKERIVRAEATARPGDGDGDGDAAGIVVGDATHESMRGRVAIGGGRWVAGVAGGRR